MRVLFVCLGNICRSPMAEGLFIHKTKMLKEKFYIDSAGTSGYHVGAKADARMRKTAETKGVELPSRSRQLVIKDLEDFDYVVAMDKQNYQDILTLKTKHSTAKVVLIRDFDPTPDDGNVPDPYYGGTEGFEKVFEILDRSCDSFLEHILNEKK